MDRRQLLAALPVFPAAAAAAGRPKPETAIDSLDADEIGDRAWSLGIYIEHLQAYREELEQIEIQALDTACALKVLARAGDDSPTKGR